MSRMDTRRMNFVVRASEKRKTKKRVSAFALLIVLAIVALVVVEGALIGRAWFLVRPELNALLMQMSDESLQEDYDRAMELEAELALIGSEATALSDAFAAADSYPAMDGELFAAVRALAGSDVLLTGCAYTGSLGEFTLYGLTGDALEASEYVSRLRVSELFTNVRYYGYESDEEAPVFLTDEESGEVTVAGSYAFAVICTLEGGSAE